MRQSAKKLKAAAYARVSSPSDIAHGSLDVQIEHWTNFIKSRPEYEFVEVYFDQGLSGRITKRPGYKKMIKDALAGKIDIIFVKSIYRFGRNVVSNLTDIRALRDKEIAVIFEIENINTLDTSKEVILSLKSTFAEEQLRSISKDIKFGYRQKFSTGDMLCKPILGYDIYRIDNDYVFRIIPEESETVRLIFDLFLSGKTFTEMAAILTEQGRLNKKGEPIWYAAFFPYYIGMVYTQKFINIDFKTHRNNPDAPLVKMYAIENNHEPIISEEVFLAAKEKLATRPKRSPTLRRKQLDPLDGIVYCGVCENLYKRQVRKNKAGEEIVTYRCGKSRHVSGKCCSNSTLYLTVFENLYQEAHTEFMKMKDLPHGDFPMHSAKIQVIVDNMKALQEIRSYVQPMFTQNYNALKNELSDAIIERDIALNHIVNNKTIPVKPSRFRLEIMNAVLEKSVVLNGIIEFHFKNGVVLERKLNNPLPHRYRKLT